MKTPPVSEIQQQALAAITERWAAGQAQLVAPEYIGAWALAARNAAQYPAESGVLFVYEHDDLRDQFAHYLGSAGLHNVTIASPETVAKGGHEKFSYIATAERAWPLVQSSVEADFVLRHSARQAGEQGEALGVIQLPTYKAVGGRSLPWSADDSIRYYRELFFDQGGPVPTDKIIDLAQAGEGPHRLRFFQNLGGIAGVRRAAGLETAIYQRGLSVEIRANILWSIGNELGYTPSAEEIKAALRASGGPDYSTLIKDVGLGELRRLAGQDPEARGSARQKTLGEWTATDSIHLYNLLCTRAGKALTRRELELQLTQYEGARRPNIDEMLTPFKHQDAADGKKPFDRLRDRLTLIEEQNTQET